MDNEKDSSDYIMYFAYDNEKKMVSSKNIKPSKLKDLRGDSSITILSTKNKKVEEFLSENWNSLAHTPVFVMESLGLLFTFPVTSLDDIVFYKELTEYNYNDIPNVLNFATDEIAKRLKVLPPKCEKSNHEPSSEHESTGAKTIVECNIKSASITFTPDNELSISIRDNDTGNVIKVPFGETVVLTKNCIVNTANGTVYDNQRYKDMILLWANL